MPVLDINRSLYLIHLLLIKVIDRVPEEADFKMED